MPVYYSTGLIAGDGAILQAPTADGTNGQALTTDGSGQLAFADVGGGDITGTTAGAPSPAVDGDADTGLFSDTDDTLSVTVGGVEALRIEESAGDVTWVGSIPLLDATYTNSLKIGSGASIVDPNINGGTAIGVNARSTGWSSTAIGYYANAARFSVAIGADVANRDLGQKSVSIGNETTGNHDLSVKIGYKATSFRGSSISLGSIEKQTMPSTSVVDFWGMSSTDPRQMHSINEAWADSTDATRKARVVFSAFDFNAEREYMRGEASGTAPMIGFLGASAVAQQSGTGETTGFTAGSGTGVNDDSTFTGNVGATAYRINDVVKALKNYGLLAS